MKKKCLKKDTNILFTCMLVASRLKQSRKISWSHKALGAKCETWEGTGDTPVVTATGGCGRPRVQSHLGHWARPISKKKKKKWRQRTRSTSWVREEGRRPDSKQMRKDVGVEQWVGAALLRSLVLNWRMSHNFKISSGFLFTVKGRRTPALLNTKNKNPDILSIWYSLCIRE